MSEDQSRRFGFAAGVAAALVMLAAIGLMRVLSGVLSLPEIVGEGVLLRMPGAFFSMLLDALQQAAKPLFYLAIGIGVLVVGGALGSWYGGLPSWRRAARLVVGVWLVFGLVVYPLLGAGVFGAALLAGPIWHGVSLLLVCGLYGLVLYELHAVLARRTAAPGEVQIQISRRRLLRDAGAALIGVVVLGGTWRVLSTGSLGLGGSAPVATGARPPEPANAAPFDLAGLPPEVTPTSAFYTVSKNFIDPVVAGGGWHLRIDGLVEQPLELTYDELVALPASEGYYTLMCISNETGGDLWGNAYWRGVKLHELLERAGVRPGVVDALFSAADDYRDSVPITRALHPDTLLAWEMNGAPLAREHGFPARLLIPGIYGMKNVKWLTGITLVDHDVYGFWQNQGWDDAAPYQTESRIDVPRARETLPAGRLAVGGRAYAGDRGIQAVEVSTDIGRTWQAAQVKPALSAYSWQMWRADVQVGPEVRDLRVRATDGLGHPQPSTIAPPFPAGATGYHHITVAVQS